MASAPTRKHLVLLGAGRSHLQVLRGLARQRTGELALTLVAPSPYYIEPALLPGYLVGDYALEDVRIPLDALVEASGAQFVPAHVLSLDPAGRRVQLSSGDALPYDVLSIDVEPAIDREAMEAALPGARHHALPTHPLENFVKLWPQLMALARERPLQVAVIGGDLAAVELALAAAQVLGPPHGSRVTLVAGPEPLLARAAPALERRALARLKALNITVLADRAVAIEPRHVRLASGATLMCDAPLLVAPPATPAWLAAAGLQADDAGAPVINERLQSESHRQVFIVPGSAPPEAGPALDANLRTAIAGGAFRKVPLAAPRLALLASGERQAIAVWGPLALEGREVWHWKDRRDRRQLAALFEI